MKRAIVTPAEMAGAALDELKSWLAITTTRDDACLVTLLHAALDMCEAFTGLMPLAAICEEAGEPAPTIDSFPQQGAALLAVSSDRIDAFMTAKGQLSWLLREDSSAEGLQIQPLDYQPNLEGVAVGKDSGMTEAIAAAVNQLIEDGTYEAIMTSWDVDFGLVDEAVVNPSVEQ